MGSRRDEVLECWSGENRGLLKQQQEKYFFVDIVLEVLKMYILFPHFNHLRSGLR